MRRANYWTGVVIATAITVALLTTGCMQDNSSRNAGAGLAGQSSSAGGGNLPEVVVTARRPGPDTIAMSDRESDSAAGMLPTRAHHR